MSSEIENLTRASARPLSHVEQDAEADHVPADWLMWSRSSGTLAEHLAGTALWTHHDRREIPIAVAARKPRSAT